MNSSELFNTGVSVLVVAVLFLVVLMQLTYGDSEREW